MLKSPLRNHFFIPAAAALALALVTAFAWQKPDALTRFLDAFLETEAIPGAVIAFGDLEQTPRLRSFGLADPENRQPMPPGQRFRIASLSKPLTAAMVLELIAQGRLSLDERLAALFPEIAGAPDLRYRDITIRDLLRHSAGWDRTIGFEPIADPNVAHDKLGVENPETCRTLATSMLPRPLQFAPGSRYAYSNLGYCWLEAVIEKATGRSYEAAVLATILSPLGILSMQIGEGGLSEKLRPRHFTHAADGVGAKRHEWPGRWLNVLGAAGGWIATADEFYRFASRPVDPLVLERPPYAAETDDSYYGLGWRVWPRSDGYSLTHYGAIPGIFSLVIRDSNGLLIVALFNGRPRHDEAAFERLFTALPRIARNALDGAD